MRTKLNQALQRVHARFMFEIDPFVLGVFRLALGAYLLLFLLLLGPHWIDYYGHAGLWPRPQLSWANYRFPQPLLHLVSSNWGLWCLYALSLVSALWLASGRRTKPALLYLLLITHSLRFGSKVANGEEQVLLLMLFFGLLLPLDRSVRLDQLLDATKRARMLSARDKVPVWGLTIFQVHFMLMYALSVPNKLLLGPSWVNGSAVYYHMMQLSYPRWPGLALFAWHGALLSRVLTYTTLALEILAPLLIWFRRLRLPCVLALMAMHLGMVIFLEGIMMFNLASMVGLLLFLPSRRSREWVGRWFRTPR